MENSEDLEPLFDYSRVQPSNFICIDDDDDDDDDDHVPFGNFTKRRKISNFSTLNKVMKEQKDGEVMIIETKKVEEVEDWLPPPPKLTTGAKSKLEEDNTIKELRLMKQELLSLTQSAKDILQEGVESSNIEVSRSLQSALNPPSTKPSVERAKIILSMQDREGKKQFRIYMDDKFERLFKLYADKVKLKLESLIFIFDGEKVNPSATPESLGMEDDDIIEVHLQAA